MDAEGQIRWIVGYIVGHEDPHREAASMGFHIRASIVFDGSGFLPKINMWESHFSRLRDIPDVVRAYELVDSSYPVLPGM